MTMMPALYKCKNPHCTNQISNVDHKSGRVKEFCSQKCRSHTRWINTPKKIPQPRMCAYCGLWFTPKFKTTAKFCSDSCSVRAKRKIKINKICLNCGNAYQAVANRKHCTRKCALISFHRNALFRLMRT